MLPNPLWHASQTTDVSLDVEKSLQDRAAEAEKKLGVDAKGNLLLYSQPPQAKRKRISKRW